MNHFVLTFLTGAILSTASFSAQAMEDPDRFSTTVGVVRKAGLGGEITDIAYQPHRRYLVSSLYIDLDSRYNDIEVSFIRHYPPLEKQYTCLLLVDDVNANPDSGEYTAEINDRTREGLFLAQINKIDSNQ
jgi:hypothetical protein